MAAKWTRPRQELVEIGAKLCYRGWNVQGVSMQMVQDHFVGSHKPSARIRLQRSINERFWDLYSGQTEKAHRIGDMALALHREGWTPLYAEDGPGSFWRHNSGCTVNCNGGFFPSLEAATKAAYDSETRAALLRAHAA